MPSASVTRLPGTCGVGVVYNHIGGSNTLNKSYIRQHGGGIGFHVAGFINQSRCEAVYNWIRENYDIVFQSPVKRNRNSGNHFFFIVFKEKA